MITEGSFPVGKAAETWSWHLQLVPRLRMNGDTPPLLRVSSMRDQGQITCTFQTYLVSRLNCLYPTSYNKQCSVNFCLFMFGRWVSTVEQVKVAGCANIARPRARSWHTFISAAVTPSRNDTVSNGATVPYSCAAKVASHPDSSGLLLLGCENSYKPELLPIFSFLLSMWANVDTLTINWPSNIRNKWRKQKCYRECCRWVAGTPVS